MCGGIAPLNVAGLCRNLDDYLMDCEYLTDYCRTRYLWEQIDQEYKEKLNKKSRQGYKRERTPVWSDLKKIKDIKSKCPSGYHVDHIIPLMGSNVSGLHVPENLQYLTPRANLSKGNKFNPMEFAQ